MNFYKLTLSYNGFPYEGWQKQPHDRATVQGELEKCLKELFPNSKDALHTLGSGRTDRGVHAVGQVVKLSLVENVPESGLKKALNGKLSPNIRVLECAECSSSFHPILDSLSKEYRYYLLPTSNQSPFLYPFVTYWNQPFDLSKAKMALSLFKGEHDFHNFFTTGTPVKSTVRKIYECQVLENHDELGSFFEFPEGTLCFELKGEGFLKQMVRCIMGAILSHAKGDCSVEELANALKSREKVRIGRVAPSNGLYLYQVNYP